MKTFIRIVYFLVLLISLHRASAQDFEFVENKGQWDSRVKFKGSLNAGAFFLEETGYKILLHNSDDWQKVSAYFGGHNHDIATGGGNGSGGSNGGGGHAGTRLISNPGDDGSGVTVHSHAYEVTFLGGNPHPQILPDKPVDSYYNYFIGTDASKWSTGCKIYQAVLYKNVYPNIDVRYYTDNGNLKYDIIVNPGGNATDIALRVDGADKVDVQKGSLKIHTSVGDVTEPTPYSYQFQTSGRSDVEASYNVKNNVVRFKLDNYSQEATLVIDPSLLFSTFTGSTSDNWGFTATYDGAGNLYAGGIVFGSQFPLSNGAFQTTWKGGDGSDNNSPCDIGLMKFSSNGRNRLYATFIGGGGNEQPHSLVVDNAGNLIMAGRTNSGDFPSTSPVYGKGGSFDIFIIKLNNTGTAMLAGRRFGGANQDGVNILPKYSGDASQSLRRNYGDDARSEVIVDAANNIYFTSQTRSDSFPVSVNAFQKSFGGSQDAVIIKTSPTLDVIFSSFLGGKDDDAGFVLALNPINNNIYVAGATKSTDFPGTGNGPVLFSTFQGGEADGFVSIINSTGTTLTKSSYFGTAGHDLIFGIQFDRFGFPYIMGTSTGNWHVENASYVEAGGKQFISKLTSDLSGWVYSTVFGPNRALPAISPTAFLVDRCENVYVSGWGGGIDQSEKYDNSGTLGLKTTADALYPNSASRDGADFYFFVLKKDAASLLYASMFGQVGGLGDHVDGGTSRFDKQGIIYQAICANCGGGAAFPTTPGAWSRSNGALSGRGCNLAAIKIAFNLAGVGSGLRAAINGVVRNTGCIPLDVVFTDTIAMAKKYIWNFGDNSPVQTTTVPTTTHTYTNIGSYRVMLIAVDSASCNVADTSYITIKAGDNRANLSYTYRKLTPPCDKLNYEFTNTSTATRPFTDSSFTWNMGDNTPLLTKRPIPFVYTYQSAGTYQVTMSLVDTNYCNYPDAVTQTLRIAINVKAQFETPPKGCEPYTAEFNNTSIGGQTFTWDFGDGTTSTEVSPSHAYAGTGTFTVKLIARDPSTCNLIDSTTFSIIVSPNPIASFTYTPIQPVENTPFTFTNTSIGATSYFWDFGDGDRLPTIRKDTLVSHIYVKTDDYLVSLIAINDFGCTDTASVTVHPLIKPLVDVPNAFTPNGDGINDIVRVRGYGIAKVNFRIFNRWGALMYQTTSFKGDSSDGWDGRFNGTLQPMDVYAYVLDIEFSDGRKYQKRGDVTLLR